MSRKRQREDGWQSRKALTERFAVCQRSSMKHSPAVAANEDKAQLLESRKAATTRRPTRPANGSPSGRAVTEGDGEGYSVLQNSFR